MKKVKIKHLGNRMYEIFGKVIDIGTHTACGVKVRVLEEEKAQYYKSLELLEEKTEEIELVNGQMYEEDHHTIFSYVSEEYITFAVLFLLYDDKIGIYATKDSCSNMPTLYLEIDSDGDYWYSNGKNVRR